MAWSASAIFRQYVADMLDGTASIDLDAASELKAALYDNDITPNKDVTAANSAYNVDQWVTTGNEVYEAGQWAQGGQVLDNADVTTPSSGVVMLDADDEASGSAADLANVYGCLVYADAATTPVADQGVCFNYFGGANSVTNGTFTIVWNSNGIFRITV